MGLREVLVSTVLMLLISFRPSVPIAALLPAGILLFWLGWGYVCRAKIGGITGDTMGAGIEFSETLCLLMLLFVR